MTRLALPFGERKQGPQMSSKTIPLLLVCLFALVLLTPSVLAQVAGATLSGTVADAQGAAIPDAKISITNIATGVTANTTTNSVGAYTVPNLNAGDYQVRASASGFNSTVAQLTLTVGQKQELNLALTVGQLEQAVEVTAAAPQVELTSSTIS